MLVKEKMSQRELALRADVTPSYVSSVVNNTRPISHDFARKLEYIFGYKAEQWLLQQEVCALDKIKLDEAIDPPRDEMKVLGKLQELTDYLKKLQQLKTESKDYELLVELRSWLQVSNLCRLPDLYLNSRYPPPPNKRANLYLLYTWCASCEKLGQSIVTGTSFDREKLRREQKAVKDQFLGANSSEQVQQVLDPYGIGIYLLPSFQGVSARCFIYLNQQGTLVILATRAEDGDLELQYYLAGMLGRSAYLTPEELPVMF